MHSKSRCLWPFSEHCFHATYFNTPVAEVSCVCSDKAWCALAIVNVDSMIILPHGKSPSGPRLNIKTVLSTYGDFHVKDKTAVRTSYL